MVKSESTVEQTTVDNILGELKKGSSAFFELIENANDAIYFHDPKGIVVFLNRCAEALTGYDRKEFANKHIGELFTETDAEQLNGKLQQTDNEVWRDYLTLTIRSKAGEEIPVELSVTPIKRGEKLIGFEGIARDLRGRQCSQEQLDDSDAKVHLLNLQVQKKYMKLEESARIQSEFVSSISHEFRTPLNGIVGYAELLEDKVYGDLNGNQLAALQNIKACASDLLKMVQEILDLSRLKTQQLKLELEVCNPCELVEAACGAVAPIAKNKGLQLKVTTEGELPGIRVDFKRIYQVLVNLAANAIKFTKEGEIRISAEGDGEQVTFSVKDSGIGISQELQELILHDFRNNDGSINRYYGGMGLALSLSRRLVALHDGEFWVDSSVRNGSAFYFTIPLSPKPKKRFR